MQWLGRVCFYKRCWYLPDKLLEVVQEFKDSIPNWDRWYKVSDIEVYAFQIDIHTLADKYSIDSLSMICKQRTRDFVFVVSAELIINNPLTNLKILQQHPL